MGKTSENIYNIDPYDLVSNFDSWQKCSSEGPLALPDVFSDETRADGATPLAEKANRFYCYLEKFI